MIPLLLTGAAGSGKTQAAIQHVIAQIARDPFALVWVVTPTDLHSESFRAALLTALKEHSGATAYFGVRFFDFYDLYHHLLQLVGDPQQRVNTAAQSRILRTVIAQAVPSLTHFGQIADKPGFVALVVAFIRELKQARVTPAHFSEAAHDAKDRDLALIYGQYQQLLQNRNLVDIEGEGWLALARVAEQPTLSPPVALLVVDGYDQFNRVQAELIGLLSQRVKRTVITLTYQAERADTAHRRFVQTREGLRPFVPQWTEMRIDGTAADATRSPTLNWLSANLFEPHAPATAADPDNPIQFIEIATPRHEVETALRTIKRELLAGLPADEVAIVARDLTPYTGHLAECAVTYGVPISARFASPLSENPAVATLVALIDLAAADFPRRAVIDLLRSPYLTVPGLDSAAVDALDQISRAHMVIAGKDQWRAALNQPLAPISDEDGEADVAETTIDLEALKAAFIAFLAQITPPVQADARTYIGWLEGLIGPDTELDPSVVDTDGEVVLEDDDLAAQPDVSRRDFQIVTNSSAWHDAAIVSRDLSALAAFKHQIADLLGAYELLEPGVVIAWDVFRVDLQSAIDSGTVKMGGGVGRGGRVLVGSVFDIRGLPHRLVYVLGLGEGQFPARAPEDALYLDGERAALNRSLLTHGVHLPTRSERADEASLFYELTALARQTLILSRAYSDGGNPWPPSAFWIAAQAVVSGQVTHIKLDQRLSVTEAASVSEVMVAVMADHAAGDASHAMDPLAAGAIRWLREHPDYGPILANALKNQAIERRRINDSKNEYRGYVQHPDVRQAVAEALGAQHLWSAAQFNEYAQCPFGFFAKRLLKLNPLTEPEDGADSLQIGSLMHAILETTYAHIGQARLVISAENQTQALAILEAVTAAECATAPERYGFRPDALWAQRRSWLRDQLQALVTLDFSADSPLAEMLPGDRLPHSQEAGFDSFIITGQAGPLSVRGRIDRVDLANRRALVVDYKSGSHPFTLKDMVAGRNVQMLLYTAAIAQQLKPPPESVSGAFWHIANRQLSGKLNTSSDADTVQEALDALHQHVIDARSGEFPDTPSKPDSSGKCTAYCEFSQICRVRAYALARH